MQSRSHIKNHQKLKKIHIWVLCTINRRGNWYRYANHCSVRCYINFAKSRQENSSRNARYWLPRSKECADLHDVSSSFVRELKRNNNNNNIYFILFSYPHTAASVGSNAAATVLAPVPPVVYFFGAYCTDYIR